MVRNLQDLFCEVVLLDEIEECAASADEARALVLWSMLECEMTAAKTLRSYMIETWQLGEQSIAEAADVKRVVEASCKRFRDFLRYSNEFDLDDSFCEALAHLEGLHEKIARISEDNLRVADGRGRLREPGYPEDFIGPTGFISF
ncbi:hypothetical protein [Shinella sp. M31]|uniref:hypothetical protein n=1 Tax=Shinella sp. M31 TaxID=3368615 RepID=UPI003B9FFEC7